MSTPSRSLFCVVLALFLITGSAAQAQDDLSESLRVVGETYADNYTQPFTDALGGGLNAGLFRTARFEEIGLIPTVDLYVGVTAMGVSTDGSEDSFRLPNEEIETQIGGQTRTLVVEYPNRDLPTAFGDNASPGTATVRDKETGTVVDEIRLPSSLLDTPMAPVAVPQVGIGTVFGTDAQVRYVPETEIDDYGSVSLVGVAVRHSVSQYLPRLPVSLAVQGSWQSLDLSGTQQDDIVDATGWAVNAQVSKSLSVFTFYGGLQYEQFDVDVNFVFESNTLEGLATSEITLDQEASNQTRALAGVSISLAIVRLNVDYAVSANNTVTAGLGLML